MADDIERALGRLAHQPLPSGFADVAGGVMARIETEVAARAALPSLGIGASTAIAALMLGIATASVPGGTDAAPLELSVFSADAALAPATLLTTAR